MKQELSDVMLKETVKEDGRRSDIIEAIRRFSFQNESACELITKDSVRALNREYKEKMIQQVVVRAFTKVFLPGPFRAVYTAVKSAGYIVKDLRCLLKGKLAVEVPDATAITISLARLDFNTAGSVKFLLGIG